MAFPITLTEAALGRMKRLLEKQPAGTMVRLGVKGGGCSGLEYVTALETKARDTDLRLVADGIVFLCDPKSARFLEGSTLDYTGNLIGGGFKFDNPNAARGCGCGTSFTPK